jgi:hypothetical protein
MIFLLMNNYSRFSSKKKAAANEPGLNAEPLAGTAPPDVHFQKFIEF